MNSVVLGTHLVLRGDGTISLVLDEDVHILKEDAYDALIDGIGQLKVENAKLREGISAAWRSKSCKPDECLECSYPCSWRTIGNLISTLSIEVDE